MLKVSDILLEKSMEDRLYHGKPIENEKYYIVNFINSELVDMYGPYEFLDVANKRIVDMPDNYTIIYGAALNWRMRESELYKKKGDR